MCAMHSPSTTITLFVLTETKKLARPGQVFRINSTSAIILRSCLTQEITLNLKALTELRITRSAKRGLIG